MVKGKRKLICAVALLFFLNITVILAADVAQAASYRQGSTGSAVRQIQQVLKNWGYYTGGVDGVFGPKTADAVRYFQRKNGLSIDGIVGPATQRAMGLTLSSTSAGNTNSADLNLLARIIAAESRGEPYTGQVAVGAVIMNRMRHPSFPSTLSGVIYQPGAFTAINDGQFAKTTVPDSCVRAANEAMNGSDPTGGCIYYFNPATATSKWIWSRPQSLTIGRHIFCK